MRRLPLGVLAKILLYAPLMWPHLLFFVFSKNKRKIMQDVKCSKIWPALTFGGHQQLVVFTGILQGIQKCVLYAH